MRCTKRHLAISQLVTCIILVLQWCLIIRYHSSRSSPKADNGPAMMSKQSFMKWNQSFSVSNNVVVRASTALTTSSTSHNPMHNETVVLDLIAFRKEAATVKQVSGIPRTTSSSILSSNRSNSNAVTRSEPSVVPTIAATRRNNDAIVVPPYNQTDIVRLCQARYELLHLLIFDGQEFKIFGLNKKPRYCLCQNHFMALVIDGLLTARPKRFVPGSLPFQVLLFTMLDSIYYKCVDEDDGGCSKYNFPPLITPTSVPTNSSSCMFIKQFPTGDYNKCLINWRRNENKEKCLMEKILQYNDTLPITWDTLQPQLYWRGSDIGYRLHRNLKQCSHVLHRNCSNCALSTRQAADMLLSDPDLQPRCRAVAMTLDVESSPRSSNALRGGKDDKNNNNTHKTWLNVKFSKDRLAKCNWTNCGHSIYATHSSPSTLAKFKYHIDFSGIGGTTWLGTITKLAMPGLLFHHESPTKDWFHDDMKPWEHYVPVHMNLSNMYERFVWAESHPAKAKEIAKRAQDFARQQITKRLYQTTFERLYVQGMGRIADAYRPAPNETLQSILQGYQAAGLIVTLFGKCNVTGCEVKPEFY